MPAPYAPLVRRRRTPWEHDRYESHRLWSASMIFLSVALILICLAFIAACAWWLWNYIFTAPLDGGMSL